MLTAIACLFIVSRLFVPGLLDHVSFSTAVYDRQGHLLRLNTSQDQKFRLHLTESGISPLFKTSLLAYEDRHFYRHMGVNGFALGRAFWGTFVRHHRRFGASTLTMQVARLRFHLKTNTAFGKLKQILLALLLEQWYSKNQIFETYLNLVPYGANIEGTAAASLIFFNKPPNELTFSEILALCVIPQNPNDRLPGSLENNRAQALARQRLLAIMQKHFPRQALSLETVQALPMQANRRSQLPYAAPHFVETLLPQYPEGASITTTLDLTLQSLLERKARTFIARNQRLGFKNTAMLLADVQTLEVLAEVGSVDYFNSGIQGQVNGTLGLRSPGSALKPLIYALAIDQGLIHPQTMLKDAPARYGIFNPENFDLDFRGPISATDALIHSRNIPAIFLANQLHKPDLYEFLVAAGIGHLRSKEFYGLSLVLGGAELSMQELVELYAMLARGGVPVHLKKLLGVNGKRAEEPACPDSARLLSREACYLTACMLAKNPRPGCYFRSDWMEKSFPVYWKTGTSRSFRDAWCVGFFGQYVLAVWIGNFEGQGNPAFKGRDATAPLFFEIVDALAAQKSFLPLWLDHHYAGLNTISEVEVCALSGQLPGPACSVTEKSLFIPGKSPIQHCTIHRRIYVDSRTGLRTTGPGPYVKEKVYECWPSDLLDLFRLAGIPRRVPPPYPPNTDLETREESGLPPQITSPVQHVIYALAESDSIPLTAVTDADVQALDWFANDRFLGRSQSNKVFFWKPGIGDYLIRAVDNHGRAAVRKLCVRPQQEKIF